MTAARNPGVISSLPLVPLALEMRQVTSLYDFHCHPQHDHENAHYPRKRHRPTDG